MDKSDICHPTSEEEQSYQLFKSLKVQGKEKKLKEREMGFPTISTSPEFTFRGVPEAVGNFKSEAPAATTEEYDPYKDERTFGCCMKTFLCLCFCSC